MIKGLLGCDSLALDSMPVYLLLISIDSSNEWNLITTLKFHHRGLSGKVVLGSLISSLALWIYEKIIAMYFFALLEKLLSAILLTRPTLFLQVIKISKVLYRCLHIRFTYLVLSLVLASWILVYLTTVLWLQGRLMSLRVYARSFFHDDLLWERSLSRVHLSHVWHLTISSPYSHLSKFNLLKLLVKRKLNWVLICI